jgi:protein-L-isoaspartate(D-aspartate) O-methyltransferase
MSTLRDRNGSDTDEIARVAELRDAMVRELHELGAIHVERVAAAFHAVPRHLFAPEASLENVYAANRSVVTKTDENGAAVSSVSAPTIQATMLEQADLHPGMRVLEIGSGGYNAALIAELVGADGAVTTVDIDPDVVDRARRYLGAAGYGQVTVVLADATNGAPEHAPFDRIIVTAGAWDLPSAWADQLAADGRLVVPLRLRGLTRSFVFEREAAHWVSRGHHLCGFVPMQGTGAHEEQMVLLHADDVGLKIDGEHSLSADLLSAALAQPQVERWSGVTVGGMEPFDDLDFWLATTLPQFGILLAQPAAVDAGLVGKWARWGAPTAAAEDSFAYRTLRRVDPDTKRSEFGVFAHGPQADALADRMADLIRAWDHDHRGGPGPRIAVYPATTPDADLPAGLVIDKTHTRIVVSWPAHTH